MPRTIDLLLADDNEDHRFLTRKALRALEGDVTYRVHAVADGEEALDFLHRRGRHTDAPRPDVVLLDLKMPRRDGFAVLADVKADPDLRAIPIIVLSSSDHDADLRRARDLGTDGYITKPLDPRVYAERIRDASRLWLTPRENGSAGGSAGPGSSLSKS